MTPSSFSSTLPAKAAAVAAMLSIALTAACGSAVDPSDETATDPTTEEAATGQSQQALCYKCDPRPKTRLNFVIGDGEFAQGEPEAGDTFQCKPPMYSFIDGKCYIGIPAGGYPTTLYSCPIRYPILRCDWRGYCTCWTY